MTRCTAEERALARAAVYRLLALAFAYPTSTAVEALRAAIPVARTGAHLISAETERTVDAAATAFESASREQLERLYQKTFTLTYSQDCPAYETAFSARHLFQQSAHQADIAGFYRAFGVESHAERPDHLATELEFAYLLALKEAHARERAEQEHVRVTRDATRAFLRDHLARWAPLIAGRIANWAPGTPYAAAARALGTFIQDEERFLRLGRIERYRDEPAIEEVPEEFTCPFADGAPPTAVPLFEETEEGEYVAANA
ncbi:MAG: hypothetical protein Kow0010_08360 [Dehalococcoidia bacterium]